jgi:hypothetical protein
MKTLNERVRDHYEACLGANASWRNFTNSLALLNAFGILNDDDFEFVVDLFLEHDDFEDEDLEELTEAVGLFLEGRRIPTELIDSHLLINTYAEYGYTCEQFVDFAQEAGVSEDEIAIFLKEEGES